MRRFLALYLSVVLILVFIRPVQSSDAYNSVQVSVTLSGHVMIGVGFEHGIDRHHAVQIMVYPLIVPGKGFPFALQAGYNYYSGRAHWKGKLGLAGGLIVSPPDPDKRKFLSMILITPGIQYVDGNNHYNGALWLARFLGQTNQKWPIVPIGIEARYGRTW